MQLFLHLFFNLSTKKFFFFFQAAEKHVTAEETVQQLQNQVQDLQAELNRVRRGF